ncbi:winged helix-turn-helix transcriptional regulator [Anaeromicropila herbilytica]|uniref:HxlR family transcriptional regulator n=1 Tax=Anaeromicropila herbilytica TaxID=2785025 RepID=A0A7R7EGR5_9FIRM|nr:helix-turn-helix domain-containing protein [Anaeromicropila herbilytica]BCN28900.1 HxlR family transcriptional regulator [Anaeromicropila herbilytica]
MALAQELEVYLNILKQTSNHDDCPIKCTLEVIGGKWKLRILAELLKNEVCRFNGLKREISGITNTMLSNSLHELEHDNLVKRIQYNEMPVRVEYSLTEAGKSLLPLFYEIAVWWNKYNC